jgi:DNA replication and repair protein RecF
LLLKADSVAITQLTLNDFRNYAELRLDVDASAIVLTGPNGAGKTNLLEAISLLAPGRGLRAAAYHELLRRGASGGWAVAAKVGSATGLVVLGTAYQGADHLGHGQSSNRRIVVDGLPQKSAGAFCRHIRVLWLTPAMDRIFSGPPSDRRRLFDRLTAVIDPDHAGWVSRFERLTRERNRLLSRPDPDASWLSGLEQQMAEEAVALAASRLSALEVLTAEIARNRTTSFPKVKLALEGDLEQGLRAKPAVQVEDRYRRMLCDSRKLDRTAGRTLAGPHRTDLKATHGPTGMEAGLCSTGEQKAMLIGIILAHARAMNNTLGGMLPVLLLDEVVAHLDTERRAGLYHELRELGAQCWLTGTDRALFDGMAPQASFYSVKDGALAPIS